MRHTSGCVCGGFFREAGGVAQLVECSVGMYESQAQCPIPYKPGVLVYTCNPSA